MSPFNYHEQQGRERPRRVLFQALLAPIVFVSLLLMLALNSLESTRSSNMNHQEEARTVEGPSYIESGFTKTSAPSQSEWERSSFHVRNVSGSKRSSYMEAKNFFFDPNMKLHFVKSSELHFQKYQRFDTGEWTQVMSHIDLGGVYEKSDTVIANQISKMTSVGKACWIRGTSLFIDQPYGYNGHLPHFAENAYKFMVLPEEVRRSVTQIIGWQYEGGLANNWTRTVVSLFFPNFETPPMLDAIELRKRHETCSWIFVERGLFTSTRYMWFMDPLPHSRELREKASKVCKAAAPQVALPLITRTLGSRPKLLMLLRENRRVLVNSQELIEVAIRKGFEVRAFYIKSDTTFCEQRAAFEWADVVTGIHGAEMTNIAFMRPFSVVVELIPVLFYHPCFKLLSAVADVHHLELPNIFRNMTTPSEGNFDHVKTIQQCKALWPRCVPQVRDGNTAIHPLHFSMYLDYAKQRLGNTCIVDSTECMSLTEGLGVKYFRFCGPAEFPFRYDDVIPP